MIPVSKPFIDNSDINSVINQISSGWISSNANVIKEFESELANYLGCNRSCALAVSNGTTAIELALRSFQINQNKKVIVPDITFAATINAVLAVGLEPLILPVDEDFCYEETIFKEVINSDSIGAIIFVHLYGTECIKTDQYELIKKNKNIYSIADCAESLDAFIGEKHLGLNCDAFTFSFFANKIITTGEGGFLGFKDVDLANKAKLIRDHGMSNKHKYWHLEYGTNSRMAALQASLGLSQLKKIDFLIKERKKILEHYIKLLNNSNYFRIWKQDKYLSIWFVNLTIKNNIKNKNLLYYLANFLEENGIETRPCFHNLSYMPIYNKFSHSSIKEVKNSPPKNLKLISLPTYVGLEENEILRICSLILKFESLK